MHAVTGQVTVMHLALDPAPPLRRAVQVADLLRSAALSQLGRRHGDSALAGKAADGAPLAGNHRHAHWLPVTDGAVLAGICLWAPGGLDGREVRAVASVRHLGSGRMQGGPLPLMRVTHLPEGGPVPAVLAGPSPEWESLTPFSPPRFGHPTTGFLAGMVAAEAVARGLPAPVSVTRLGGCAGWLLRRPSRPEAVPAPQRIAVIFPGPVAGPLALGRLSHFGLGVLVPA